LPHREWLRSETFVTGSSGFSKIFYSLNGIVKNVHAIGVADRMWWETPSQMNNSEDVYASASLVD